MADLASFYQDPELLKAQNTAQNAATQASAYQSAASLLPDKLKQAIGEKLDYNKDIIEQKNKAMGEYFASPSVAREKYQNIWNPFEREKLVAQERQQAYQPYANLSDILQDRRGNIQDIIGAGTGAFNSAVTAQQNAAQLARQNFEDLFGLAGAKADAAYKEASLDKSGSGSGSSPLDEIIAAILGGQMPGGQGPAEPKPTWKFSASSRASGSVPHYSPEGEWVWDISTQDWYPAVD